MENKLIRTLFSGFSKLNRKDRLKRLVEMGALSKEDVKYLSAGSPADISLAEKFIENVIGYFPMPMGVVANFVMDKKAYIVPMAVEETSIIAAASKTAKWVRDSGSITTEMLGQEIIGQIQIAKVSDYKKFEKVIIEESQKLITMANEVVAHGLVRRGGGVNRISVREIKRTDGATMAVVHVYVNPCDAMGANIINQVCEFLKPEIEELTGETVTMCILSNLVDSKLTKAKIEIKNVDPELGQKIQEASIFANSDPYRAATNNKGVLNGIDPILIATGNDWRAVEAGIHAYAANDGQYRSITNWFMQGSSLIGELVAPVIVGVVGGVTKLHPNAKMGLKMLGVESAEELSRICASMGLVQNLGALKALTTVGITEGHMKLHIKNLTLGAGANEQEVPLLQKKLEEILRLTKRISLSQAIEALNILRSKNIQKL